MLFMQSDRKFNIGMILDATFPPDPRVEREAKALIQAGYNVFLFCLTNKKNQLGYELYKEIHVHRYLLNRLLYKLSALAYTIPLYSYFMKLKIIDFLKKNKIDLIHVHDLQICGAVELANKRFDKKMILDLHENRPEIMKFYPHLNRFPGNLLIKPSKWKSKEAYYVSKSDKVIVVTEEAKDELVNRTQINPQDCKVVPNTVSHSFYSKLKPKKPSNHHFTLLYIGDLGLRRGLLDAIEGVKIVENKMPKVQLKIVGGNQSNIKILKDRVIELGLEKNIFFLRWRDESEFPTIIAEADVCICPLHRNLHHDTTYANKLFQYMSIGKPLLVSNAKAQQKLVLDHGIGLVHKEKNAEDFAKKVLEFYEHPKMIKEMGERAKDLARNKLSWEQTSQELITLYQELIP